MLLANSLNIILLSLLPGLIYLCIIYITTPYNSWNFKKALLYLIGGTLSVPLIFTFFKLVPIWNTMYLDITNVIIYQIFILSFIQIALFEETVKFLLFQFFRKVIIPFEVKHHPLSIMIYTGAVSLGFAFVENILYATKYGSEVLLMRSVTAVIIHMLCGMMLGYFISLSKFHYKIKTSSINMALSTSIFDIFMRSKPKLRKIFYIFLGISVSAFFHGIYDFNLLAVSDFGGSLSDSHISFTIQTVILTVGFYIVKKMANHLVKINIKLNLDEK